MLMRSYSNASTRKSQIRSAIWGFLIASTIILSACTQKNQDISTQWILTPDAQENYITLLLDQSIRSNDLEGVREAATLILQFPPMQQRSTDIAAWLLLAKEYGLARDILNKALPVFPNALTLHLLMSEAYLELNQPQKALECIKVFAKNNPKHPQIQQELAILNLKAGKTAEAVSLFASLPVDEKTPFIRYFYAQALKAEKQYNKAIIQLQKILDDAPDFMEAWTELAIIYTLQNNIDDATQTYDTLLALKPDIQEPWLRAIQFYLRHDQMKKVLDIINVVPDTYDFLLATAAIMIEEDAFSEAAQLTDRIARDYPDKLDVAFLQATLAFKNKSSTEKTLQYLQTIPDDSRFYTQAINLHIHILMYESRLKEALSVLQKARDTMPDLNALAHLEIQILTLDNNYEKALERVEENQKNWPTDHAWLYTKASLYHTLNRQQETFDTMEQVILLDPNNYQALNYIGYTLADEDRDLKRAITLLNKAVFLAPDKAYILDSLAWAEFKIGDVTKALATIRRATSLPNSDEAIIWEHYGDIAHAAGYKEEAILAWQKALTFEPENTLRLQEKLQRP